ncbi:MAG: hypothetical protein VKN13_00310 [Cyanobacteriota bacterium]|nr:hypothetical protein [Cyanobacteriota bacterium]
MVRLWPGSGLALLVALMLGPHGARAEIVRPQPSGRQEQFDPDAASCRPEALSAGFQQQLAPFADQPPAVLERLRALQAELAERSLERCLQRGLLTAKEAEALRRQFGSDTRP